MQRGVLYAHMHHHRDRRVAYAIAFQRVGGAPFGTLQQLEARPHAAFGVVEECVYGVAQYLRAESRMQRLPTGASRRARRPLRTQIAFALELAAETAVCPPGTRPVPTRMTHVKMRSFIAPGDVLDIGAQVAPAAEGHGKIMLTAQANGRSIATARLEYSARPAA